MKALKALRNEKQKTQAQMAAMIGLTQQAYAAYENDVAQPPLDVVDKLAEYFNVSVDYLLGRTTEQQLPSNCYDAGELSYFPVIGTVTAGYEGVAVENYTGETITIPKSMLHGRRESDYCVLQVKGDSMHPKLLDGDKVLVLKVDSVDSGTVAVVLYNGCEATVKKVIYQIGEDWVKLIPENSNYPPLTIEGSDLETCKIIGKVVMLIRNF